jgi:antitoxin ParD1/3/4
MKIELSDDQRWWIEHEVASGRFDTPEAVIAHAIRQAKFLALRAKIQASIAAGGENSDEDVTKFLEESSEQLAKEGY